MKSGSPVNAWMRLAGEATIGGAADARSCAIDRSFQGPLYYFQPLALIGNREGCSLLKAAPTGRHKVEPATLGDYRTIMRLSQFAGAIIKTGLHDSIGLTPAFMSATSQPRLTRACNKSLTQR